MEQKIKKMSKETLEAVLLKMIGILSEEQCRELELLIDGCQEESIKRDKQPVMVRMSQELVDEKMEQIKGWMNQIDEGELYLNVEEYEDYSSGYWDRDWITEYYDNQGIGDKMMSAIRFAKDCVDDRKYQEANFIYEWLWEMTVYTDSEYGGDPVDLEVLAENGIIRTDMKQLALLTLYADYQVQRPGNRAEDIYLYFVFGTFQKLHIEEMFHAGRENLTGTEQFWKDWIALLKTKSDDTAGRLLQEAVLYSEGIDGLLKMADENSEMHPSLYLAAMKEYDKNHDYAQIVKIGQRAMQKLDDGLKIRGILALKAAHASSSLGYMEDMMQFCWECFRSDSTDRNFLRLFGMEEMAQRYGMRGGEVLCSRIKGNSKGYVQNAELQQNAVGDYGYLKLKFYTGDFRSVKQASKNPQDSLGWSGNFIQYGIRLILLYLYDAPLPSKAAAGLAEYVGFRDAADYDVLMDFEREIIEESSRHKVSTFWNYFQRWKRYFPMEEKERKEYLSWAEKIIYNRADAIVGGQHRNHYGDAAQLLAVVGEIKEHMGMSGAKREIFAEYKKKFPRHSAFQGEMKGYFNER